MRKPVNRSAAGKGCKMRRSPMQTSSDPAAALPLFEVTPDVPLLRTLREAWSYRELTSFLVWRDVKVRYKQTLLGVLWAIVQPVALMLVFTLFLGRVVQMPAGAPYWLFVLSGLLPWQLFAHALTESSQSLVTNERLITKVYFPRVIIPASAVLGGLVDFAVGLVVLIAAVLFKGQHFGGSFAAAPLFALQAMLAAFGAGLWLSALNVQYRDVRHVLTLLVQLWLFVTPVIYPSSVVPERWRVVYALNPMAGAVEGFRWAFLGGAAPPAVMLATSAAATAVLVASGLVYFARMEAGFADVI